MSIASRTPEGWPSRRPICGAETALDFSEPTGDAPCPNCGHLIWRSRELVDQVRERIAEKLGVPLEMVTLAMTMKELGADSLDTVELVMELEEEFGLTITDAEALGVNTVADAIRLIILRQLGVDPAKDEES